MTNLFLSYRTDDSVHATTSISDQLAQHFGRDHVFRDQDSLKLGALYPDNIRRALTRCDYVIAIIGPGWLAAQRLDDPDDWVRTELRMAFELRIPVIPVLLDQTPLPMPAQLPADLTLLSVSTSIQIRHQSLAADVRVLIERIDPPVANNAAPATFSQTNHGDTVYSNQGSGDQIIGRQR